MKRSYSLAGLNWTLVGTKPFYWKLDGQMERMEITQPEEIPVPAPVPGSVHQALLNAGVLPDWNIGTNYRLCEWVENRHWLYFLDLPETLLQKASNEKILLRCLGLDNCGEIWLNGSKVGSFDTAFHSYCFDLTDRITSGNNRLCILFTCPERYQGQVYWTSKTNLLKPRFYYNWDWCPRIIQTGIWDDLFIEITGNNHLPEIYTHTELLKDLNTGLIHFHMNDGAGCDGRIRIELFDTCGRLIVKRIVSADEWKSEDGAKLVLCIPQVARWNVNGAGEQVLYKLCCTLIDMENRLCDHWERTVGFRRIDWKPCAGAPAGATPWLCCINGKNTFLLGINWTPIRTLFADVDERLYRERLQQYKNLGFHILRVWGGAMLEKECFYRICDELGLLVWQEFPLSSSGIDNTPPIDDERVGRMQTIVHEYVLRRHHHASLAIWSGGNELYDEANARPLDFTHRMLKAIANTVEKVDVFHRLLPASPSGPVIYNDSKHYGKGIQWDVHGPWRLPEEPVDEEMGNVCRYWSLSDALLHSEAGVAGASSAELIKRYCGTYDPLPVSVDNPIWAQFSWWIDAEAYRKAHDGNPPETIEAYVDWSQKRQLKGLAIALTESIKRFPSCGGFFIWMGHDCFPCPANTSIIDFEGNLKPIARYIFEIIKPQILKSTVEL